MGVSGSQGLLLDVNARFTDLLSNIVWIAPSLSLLRFDIPKLSLRWRLPRNNPTVNCSLQSMVCCVASHCSYAGSPDLPRPFHSKNRILREFVYVNRANRCVRATQRRTILHNRKVKRRKNVRLLCCSSASVPVMT